MRHPAPSVQFDRALASGTLCTSHSRAIRLLEDAQDALVLLDVPAVLIVVAGDRYGDDIAVHLLPQAGTCHLASLRLLAGGAQVLEFHSHALDDTVKLLHVLRTAVVRGNREDAQH